MKAAANFDEVMKDAVPFKIDSYRVSDGRDQPRAKRSESKCAYPNSMVKKALNFVGAPIAVLAVLSLGAMGLTAC
jgi:hypothetical protein